MRTHPLRASAIVASVFAFVGCNAVLGISEDPILPGAGKSAEGCVLDSDCSEPQVCLFEMCSPPCAADRDCDDGERCLRTSEGAYCAKHEKTACENTEACPASSNCTDGACRNPCEDASECQGGQECVAGYCVGSDAEHDPAIATPCEDGAARCEGLAQAERSVCNEGVWEPADPCEGGQLCDSQSDPPGECADVEDLCFGKQPNEFTCTGSKRTTCGPDLVTIEVEECLSSRHCTEGLKGCAECLPNQYRCDGQDLLVCNAEADGFDFVETCSDADPCNAEAGACTKYACLPEQKRCLDGLLQACNAEQSAFETVEDCGEGLCDSATLSCDECVQNTSICKADGHTVVACNEDGTSETETDCSETDKPFCANGECTECLGAEDCHAGSCTIAACNGGTCGTTPRGVDLECVGEAGYCDGEGSCQECNDEDHCLPTSGECYLPTCNNHQCGEAPKGAGESCGPSGSKKCDGDGACVQCIDTVADCNESSEVCRMGTCADALDEIGWPGPLGTTTALVGNTLYTFLLPQLSYKGTLERFIVYGISGTAGNYIMGLYEGDATRPNGSPIAVMTQSASWPNQTFSALSDTNVELSKTKRYWVALMVTAAVNISTTTTGASGQVGWRYPNQGGNYPAFPAITDVGLAVNNVHYALQIGVHYAE
jgi:hypothetical protein